MPELTPKPDDTALRVCQPGSAAGRGERVVPPTFSGVWQSLPAGFRLVARAQLLLVFGLASVAFVLGKTAVDPGYERLAFAIPAHPPQPTWNAEVDGFAQRVARAFGVRPSTAKEFSGWILEASERHEFRPELIASLVLTESSFRKRVESSVGAVGPAQVRPQYWQRFCGNPDLWDPAENIYCGAQVLAYLRDHCGNDQCALKAYNIGRYSRQEQAGRRYVDKIDRYLSSLEAI